MYSFIQKNLNKAPLPLFRFSKTSEKSVQYCPGAYTANFEKTSNVVHTFIRCSCFMPQPPLLSGEIFKIFGKCGEPYMGELVFYRGLDNSLETMR